MEQEHETDTSGSYEKENQYLDNSKYTREVHPSSKWDFISFTRHNYYVTEKDDKDIRIRNVIINLICIVTIALGVVVLQVGYSGTRKAYFRDTAAQVIKVVINALSIVLIAMLIEYRLLHIRIDMRKWQSEDISFSFRSHTCLRNMVYLIFEVMLALPQPIAFIPKVDRLALLMVLRIFFITRLIRDYHPLYRRRREIWKDTRLLYSHNPDMFNTLTVFRMTFKQHTAIIVFCFCLFVATVSSYSFYVADRAEDTGYIWLDWLYFTVITAATVGYGDISPHTSISKVVAMLTALAGTILLALLVGVISAALTPTDFQKEADTWLRMRKQKKERREYSAQFIQLVYRHYIRKKKFHSRNAKEDREYNRKSIRLITRLRRLRKAEQWTKIASAHPLQFQLEELEVKYECIKQDLRSTNAKLEQLLKLLTNKGVEQTQERPLPSPPPSSPSSSPPSPSSPAPSPSPHPRVLASPPSL